MPLRVDLPSMRPDGTHNWVELRDKPRPLDYAVVQEAVKFTVEVTPDGRDVRQVLGGNDERMRLAMLARAITAWSFEGTPVPAQNIARPEEVIDTTLDADDFDTLCDAVQPLLDRVSRRPKTTTATEP